MALQVPTSVVGLAFVGSGVIFYCLFRRSEAATSLAVLLASVVGALVGGFGVPLRTIVEGSFSYLYFVLIVFASTVFMDVQKRSGAFNLIVQDLVRASYRVPLLLLVLLMFVVILPGAITGIGTVAVLATGGVVGGVLRGLGLPLSKVAAFVAMGGVLGLAAPPVNLYAMIIASANNMPYAGFFGPLSLLVVPLGVFSALYFGARYVGLRKVSLKPLMDGLPTIPRGMTRWRAYGPFIIVVVMIAATYAFPFTVPVLGLPLIFLIGAALALLAATERIPFLPLCRENLKVLLPLVAILASVGAMVNVLTLTGVKGLFILTVLTLPAVLTYIGAAVGLPIACSLFGFAGAGVLGTPIVLGFLSRNIVVVAAAVSTILPLGALIPPTALTGKFAAYSVDFKGKYGEVMRNCLVPSLVLEVVCILAMIYATPLGKLFG